MVPWTLLAWDNGQFSFAHSVFCVSRSVTHVLAYFSVFNV